MIRAALAATALCALALALQVTPRPRPGTPLWPGARYTAEDRDRAVTAGMWALHHVARDRDVFADHGHDLIGAFFTIYASARDPNLRQLAFRLGYRHSLEWRRIHPTVPADTDADDVVELIMGADTCERFGLPDAAFRRELTAHAARFTVLDYLGWDPAREAPPDDIPDPCPRCSRRCSRGAVQCDRCGRRLTWQTRYAIWTDALIYTYMGDRFGIRLGARLHDVAAWFPAMRPYPNPDTDPPDLVSDAIYALTHFVYTSNEYGLLRLSPACFPDEFAYLRASLARTMADQDSETAGEHLDSLRAFGLGFDEPDLRAAAEFVLSTRNLDGSFGNPHELDPYNRYHTTWTAIDGLREYNWGPPPPCPAP